MVLPVCRSIGDWLSEAPEWSGRSSGGGMDLLTELRVVERSANPKLLGDRRTVSLLRRRVGDWNLLQFQEVASGSWLDLLSTHVTHQFVQRGVGFSGVHGGLGLPDRAKSRLDLRRLWLREHHLRRVLGPQAGDCSLKLLAVLEIVVSDVC